MERLQKIKDIINKNGSISLSRFVHFCLYDREIGYYEKKKIGSDFITSPEVSQMFGECVSIFIITMLKSQKLKNFCELGPGNGTLIEDLITTKSKNLKKKLNIFLYDKSQIKKILQKKKIKKFRNQNIKINILKNFRLKKEPYFFICNEFFDALPINQFEMIKNHWYEKRITVKNGFFKIVYQKNNFKNEIKSKSINGDVIETSPLTDLYLNKIFQQIKIYGGGVLIFDYGPYLKKKIDTLQVISKSKKANFLENVFESDITYHVDFEKIKEQSNSFGLYNYGPISQKKFLFFYGINERLMTLLKNNNSNKTQSILNYQFNRLTDPKGMGGLIKCLFITNKNMNIDAFRG